MLARALACVASGALIFLAAPDFDLWFLGWVAFVPLLWALESVPPRRAALLAWCAGFVTHAGGFYWVTGLLMRFGHLPLPVAALLWILLSAYQGAAFAAFGWAYAQVRGATRFPAALVAPVAMTVFDFGVPQLFPCYLGISQAWVLPVIQVAELTGPVGVTFLMVFVAAAIWELLANRRWRPLAVAAVVMAITLGLGVWRIHEVDARRALAPKRKIGAVQANVGIFQKGLIEDADRQHALNLQLSRDLERRGADLIVWPESAYPYYYWRDARQDWPLSHPWRIARDLHRPVLFGAVTFDRQSQSPYNSTMLAHPDGTLDGPYDKVYLLLFGEYVPFYDELQIRRWIPESSNFARGQNVRLFEWQGMRIGPLICYEDIIPGFARKVVKLGPNLLVNTTNDAWFGATSEPWQHLALSVFRSVEHRLDLVRAVNTGVTAHIDATGRVREKTRPVDPQLEPNAEPMTLMMDVVLLEPSGAYGFLGDAFGLLNVLALFVMLLWRRLFERAA